MLHRIRGLLRAQTDRCCTMNDERMAAIGGLNVLQHQAAKRRIYDVIASVSSGARHCHAIRTMAIRAIN